ncbi:glycosyl hydrolase [Hamadaea sp. NPDC050747]|uniref:glycoside hydrolase family 26 protein n=1 Tax=Hamadaea sp. NPDC050747 TaxID=3155789 RepID=UPI0033DD49D0
MRRLLALVAVGLLALTACSPPPGKPAPEPSTLDKVTPHPGPYAGGAVTPPATGAWLGAWVRPAQLTQAGRIAAVRHYEESLGRRLRIVNTYRRIDEPFDTFSDRQLGRKGSTLMLSWATGDTRSITLGHSDRVLRTRAAELRRFGDPVLLRVRWEMDRPNLAATMWSAEDYIAAWRHIRAVFAEEGVRNVAWVWCPTAEGFAAGRAASFYPGDDTVDWICVDAYAGSKLASLQDLLTPFLAWAAQHPKPIVVGEFGVARTWGPTVRTRWLREAADFVRDWPQIKAVAYFESDPDGNGANGQFRLGGDPAEFAAFRSAFTTLTP